MRWHLKGNWSIQRYGDAHGYNALHARLVFCKLMESSFPKWRTKTNEAICHVGNAGRLRSFSFKCNIGVYVISDYIQLIKVGFAE